MNRSKWFALIVLGVALAIVAGCAPRAAQVVRETVVVEVERPVDKGLEKAVTRVVAEAPAPREGYAGGDEELAWQGEGELERMIIRSANLSVVVEDTDETLHQLHALVKLHDGYIADSSRWLVDDDRPMATVRLRVPAESLDQVLDAIRDMAIKVENENTSGQDVTEEYTDLQARLRNKEAYEKELLALLTEIRESRGKAEEILEVYRELTRIRGEIESLKGRSQYLERMTALATIDVSIRPKEVPKALVETEWDPLVTLSKAARSFRNVLLVFIDIGIYLVIFSPFVIVPVVIIWLLVRRARRRKKRAKAAPSPEEQ